MVLKWRQNPRTRFEGKDEKSENRYVMSRILSYNELLVHERLKYLPSRYTREIHLLRTDKTGRAHNGGGEVGGFRKAVCGE